ncbi:MAG: 16S rRNA (adenine(1518)-N(6)/adenine(1519)-N(6))-dimethyltransferase, partial [Clostridia bacterium]|nr:16S rRNA (adenine(1518)-N(6)/adenine(1519)-N(6))-dimethyltransferase [Clostridia bacterium]
MTVSDIKALLQQEGLTPNKALGQNFLVDEAAALRIAEASGAAEYPVLEIGPGLGALTEMLLRISP